MRGKTPAGLRLRAPDRSEFEEVCELFSDLVPEPFSRAAMAAFLRPLDEMSVAILPSFRVHLRDEGTILKNSLPESVLIVGHASEAYDQHERTGRRALASFANSLAHTQQALASIPAEVRNQIVMDGVFLVEGQCADARWAGEERSTYLSAFGDFMLTRHGISADQAQSVRAVIEAEIPTLNEHRVKAVRAAGLS